MGNASTRPLPARELLRMRQSGILPSTPPETKEFATRETPWGKITPPGPEALDPDQPETISASPPDLAQRGFRRSPTSDIPADMPSRVFKAQGLRGYNWEEKVINVDPSDFVDESLNNWISRHFGYKKYGVRDDLQRTGFQRSRYSDQDGTPVADGNNEPVIVVRVGDKFRLIEGFHRTMWLLLAGAPEEQLQGLRDLSADPRSFLDFDPWKEVPIRAYVGTKANVAAPAA